jgi:hypothetical protein
VYLLQAVEDPLNILQFGVLGVVLLALVSGYLWAKPAVDEIKREAETNRAQLAIYERELVPDLKEAVSQLRYIENTLNSQNAKLDRIIWLLEHQQIRGRRDASG